MTKLGLLAALVCVGCVTHAIAPPAPHAATARADEWGKLSFEQRHSVMTFTVLPNMARAWQEHMKSTYAEMTCRTCHGEDAEVVSYRMPNPTLPAIDPRHPPRTAMAQFMAQKVVPDMLDLIETSPQVFSCNACHPRAR